MHIFFKNLKACNVTLYNNLKQVKFEFKGLKAVYITLQNYKTDIKKKVQCTLLK